ncbi:MAG: hypothetical protein PHH26_01485, partial [Candidatus Thermoplasmatota archaeon]|nr:hypothetical protein [Candidatus Thermoplasmatota archaeon]
SDDADALTSPAPPFVVKKPVIYFHTPRLIGNATVHLGIGPQGFITETIPQMTIFPSFTGTVGQWQNLTILQNGSIISNGTHHPYLFYEGVLLNYGKTITANVTVGETNAIFRITNANPFEITDIFFVYGSTNYSTWQTEFLLLKIDSLEANESKEISINLDNASSLNEAKALALSCLVSKGLTEKEASEMVDYWAESWFSTTNSETYSNIIYYIPQTEYDRLYQMSIEPEPESVTRIGAFYITDVPIRSPVAWIESIETDKETYGSNQTINLTIKAKRGNDPLALAVVYKAGLNISVYSGSASMLAPIRLVHLDSEEFELPCCGAEHSVKFSFNISEPGIYTISAQMFVSMSHETLYENAVDNLKIEISII